MSKYRFRPIQVDAYQFTGDFPAADREALPRFVVDALRADVLQLHLSTNTWSLRLPDGAGNVPIKSGNWIIEGANLSIMEDPAFQETFELAD